MPNKQCLKCGYIRTGRERAPDWQCPNCGAVYAKVEAHRAGKRPVLPPKRVHRRLPKQVENNGEDYLDASWLQRLDYEVREWSRGRQWALRLPLLFWFCWIGYQHLADPMYTSLFGGINLGIHELGHLLLTPFGQFLGVAGGTLTQLAAPLVSAFLFARQPDWFAVTVCGVWLATNLYYVAMYLGDARALELPLLSLGGGDSIHDWHYILSQLGILEWDTAISSLLRVASFLILWASIAAGAWVCWLMFTLPKSPDDQPQP